ncbi:MAG TPA: hypothetical protein VHA11_06790 [Bryobacteraceae bacterium]|nr:hypothetical protein [Bryobacteraceae bacterium]
MKLACCVLPLLLWPAYGQPQAEERLSFQTGGPWSGRVNLGADVAIVYGVGPQLPANIETWRKRGYTIHVMTGVAWGRYQDYLDGAFDGARHWDEAQMDAKGELILHGGSKTIPYISPGLNYGRYLALGVKRALDAGAEAIHLEEPEFWAAAGFEENFKREWQSYYKEDWLAPNSSPDAQYRASKLKYALYRRALSQIFDFVGEYGRTHGRTIRCYVPTHSLINYAHWRIVSPESSLMRVGADGYIAQVWTGTARTPNLYEGKRKERTFEAAFLEYGAMQNLVRASGRRVWYLNDPIEDDPNHSWDDYRASWESTLTASLLQPEVWHYEIMPWPDRVFKGRYPAKSAVVERSIEDQEKAPTGTGLGGVLKARTDVERVPIPKAYETELQSVIRALGEMKQPDSRWERAGTLGTGVLVSDTMMFQRADPSPSDANLGSFYGLALPLLKRGLPVEPVQIETANLGLYRLLLLTYEGQKPPAPEFHKTLARWVRDGGALVVVDDDRDPYCAVREWWNTAPLAYKTPRQHLFAELGIPGDATGMHRVGRGVVLREAASPAALTYRVGGAGLVRKLARQAADAVHLDWKESNALVLRRGPYVIAAGLDESVPGAPPAGLAGHFIDLFDAELTVRDKIVVAPGSRFLLFDTAARPAEAKVLAAACRVRDERYTDRTLRFQAEGIADTQAVVRIAVPSAPSEVRIGGAVVTNAVYNAGSRTVLLTFSNSVSPLPVELRF